jgi:hypothetical protein
MNVLVLDKDCVYLTDYFCHLSCLSGVFLADLQTFIVIFWVFSNRKSMISIVTAVTVTLKE